MPKSRLYEFEVPDRLSSYVDRQLQRADFWGMSMNIVVNRALNDMDRNSALYIASRIAEAKDLTYMVWRDNEADVEYVVSAERGDDNLPVVNQRSSRVDDDTYIALLIPQAQAQMLPNYFVSEWRQFLTDKEDRTPREDAELEAANIQYNLRNPGSGAPVEPPAGGSDTAEPPRTDTAGGSGTAASGEEERAAPAAIPAEGPLARFANSGKGGLANDPDEEEAIRELQTFLVDLGLDVGRNGVDGRYGPRTTQAVRDFQTAAAENLGFDGGVDGDAGPVTIPVIIQVRNDLAEIQRLIQALRNNDTREGFIPVYLKSSISKLLERVLVEDDRSDLETLVNRYRPFIEQFPNATINQSPGGDRPSLFNQAIQILGGETTPVTTEPRQTDPADGAAAPGNATGLNWDEITLAPTNVQDELGVPVQSVILQGERGADYIFVPIDSVNGLEIEYIEGSATGTPTTATVPEGLAFTINQEIERRSETEEPETDPRIEWPAPFNTPDPWPEEYTRYENIVKGVDLVRFDGEEDLTEVRWILNISERTLNRVTEINLTDVREYTNLRTQNLTPVGDLNGNSFRLNDYDNLTRIMLDLDEFNEIDDAVYTNDFTDNVIAYWETYKDFYETDRFVATVERNREWTLEELTFIKNTLTTVADLMQRNETRLTIDGRQVQGPSRRNEPRSIQRIRDFITRTIDPRIQRLEREAEQVRTNAATQKATRLLYLLDQNTNAAEHREIENIILTIGSRQEFEQVDEIFTNLPNNRGRDNLFAWFNSEGVGIGFLRHDMTNIRNHLQRIGVNVSGLNENEVASMLKRLNTILGVK